MSIKNHEIMFLNNNHKFIHNTCKKFNHKDSNNLWGSYSIKFDTVVVNLSAMKKFYKKCKDIEVFADILSYVIAHEIMHKNIIKENLDVTMEQEDEIINKTLSNDWKL